MALNQSLRNRLAELNAQIALLEGERNLIQKTLNSVTYPILTLPFEITSAIFVDCLPDLQDAPPILDFSPERLPIPVLLTQICRTWREIAFKIPRIWATFSLRVDEVRGRDHTLLPRRLAEWLEKAGSSPLSFILKRNIHTGPAASAPLLDPIFALSNRWQNVHVRLSHQDFVKEQFQLNVRGRLHSLEELRINTKYCSGTTIVTAFELAPRLRSVSLDGLSASVILLPWRQLTHFSSGLINGMDCLHVLRSADSLVECKFDLIDGNMDEMALLPKNVTLQTLHLRGDTVCSDILSILTLPSLVELQYDGGGVSDYHEDFVNFLSRSRPPLSRLSLYDGAYSRAVHGFSFLLDIAVLEISPLTVAKLSEFFQDLRTRDPASFFPNLESIAVWVYKPFQTHHTRPEDSSDVNYGDLVDALEFRRNRPGPRMKSFRMTWSHEEYTDGSEPEEDEYVNKFYLIPSPNFRINLPRLHALIEGGMCISVIAEVGEKTEVWI
ncbi:hypothetical protein C8R45DRAFT_1217710 [Mycena sanguinolenta]|nr:hypothetical protein C8R45DRAFT_1217710 [Mycena sanguinolenta]